MAASIGITPRVREALDQFERSVRASYGPRLVALAVFGSRARGDAGPSSDVDVAVVLDSIVSRSEERNRLSDLAYDAIAETGEEIQPWPVSEAEWRNPDLHRNPALLRAIRTDARELRSPDDHRVSRESLSVGCGGSRPA